MSSSETDKGSIPGIEAFLPFILKSAFLKSTRGAISEEAQCLQLSSRLLGSFGTIHMQTDEVDGEPETNKSNKSDHHLVDI